ncbi:MAG: hypothetical protein JNN08_12800 [Bryobacterales bacterium]|nr:hypothetical protein [Bryobacterales bacterium]
MLLLRWLVGLLSVLGLVGFFLIVLVGKGFEVYQSGAGSENLSRAAGVIGIPLLLAAMLVSVFLPGSPRFLHVVAAGVTVATVVCATIIPSHPGEGLLYAGFFGLWFLYYALTVWLRP